MNVSHQTKSTSMDTVLELFLETSLHLFGSPNIDKQVCKLSVFPSSKFQVELNSKFMGHVTVILACFAQLLANLP